MGPLHSMVCFWHIKLNHHKALPVFLSFSSYNWSTRKLAKHCQWFVDREERHFDFRSRSPLNDLQWSSLLAWTSPYINWLVGTHLLDWASSLLVWERLRSCLWDSGQLYHWEYSEQVSEHLPYDILSRTYFICWVVDLALFMQNLSRTYFISNCSSIFSARKKQILTFRFFFITHKNKRK